jgi:hypothetical protein
MNTENIYPMSPAPVRRIVPGEQVIKTKCLKCGNEIKIAVEGLTRAQVEAAIEQFDHNTGECPGGYHIELSGWRRMWDLDRAVAEYYDGKETQP